MESNGQTTVQMSEKVKSIARKVQLREAVNAAIDGIEGIYCTEVIDVLTDVNKEMVKQIDEEEEVTNEHDQQASV